MSEDTTENVSEDDSMKLVLVNPETKLPYEDDPIVLEGDDFRMLKHEAEAKGLSFEQYINYIVKLAITNAAASGSFVKADFELSKFEGLRG